LWSLALLIVGTGVFGGVVSQWQRFAEQGWPAIFIAGLLIACAVVATLSVAYLVYVQIWGTQPDNLPTNAPDPAPQPAPSTLRPSKNFCVVEMLFAPHSTYVQRENVFDLTHTVSPTGALIFHIVFEEPFVPHEAQTWSLHRDNGGQVTHYLFRQTTRYCAIAIKGAKLPGRIWIGIAGEGFDTRNLPPPSPVAIHERQSPLGPATGSRL
jgi:hypothetical protein